jgi:hypothetical protein
MMTVQQAYNDARDAMDDARQDLHWAKADLNAAKYACGWKKPNYPVPAVKNVLNVIAAIRCDAATDFLDIGMCGKL